MNQSEKATFAAGCYWGVEVEFRNVPGVKSAVVGSTGGHKDRTSYEEVCTGAQPRFSQPVATQIEEAGGFWPGEDDHQRDLEQRGLATCAL